MDKQYIVITLVEIFLCPTYQTGKDFECVADIQNDASRFYHPFNGSWEWMESFGPHIARIGISTYTSGGCSSVAKR